MAYTAADIQGILDGKKKLTGVAAVKPATAADYHAYTPLHGISTLPVAPTDNPHFAQPRAVTAPPPAALAPRSKVAPPIYRPSAEMGLRSIASVPSARVAGVTPQAVKPSLPLPNVPYKSPFAVNLPVYTPPAPKSAYGQGAAKPSVYTKPVMPKPIVSYTPLAAENPTAKQDMLYEAISRAKKEKAANAVNDARTVNFALPEEQRVMQYLDAGTRLNKRELEDANRIVDDFYNTYIIGKLDMNQEIKLPQEVQRRFDRISALSNKVNGGGAAVTGALSTVGGDWLERKKADNVRAALEQRPNDESLRSQLDDLTLRSTHKNARTQHPVAYTGGMFAGEAVKYASAAKALDAIPLAAKAAKTVGDAGSKLLGGKASAKVLTRLAEGRIVDLPFDVANAAAQSENPEDFAKNLGVNTAFGLGMDMGFETIGKLWRMGRAAAGNRVPANMAPTNMAPINIEDSRLLTPEQVRTQRRAGLKTKEQRRLESEEIEKAAFAAAGAQNMAGGRGFMEQINAVMRGTENPYTPVVVGDTPDILRKYGANPLKLTLKQSDVRKIAYPSGYMGGKHNLGFYALEHLPEQLENPVAILKSSTQPDSLVVFTEMLDDANRPVMIPLHLDKNGNLGISNEVSSMYGRVGFSAFVQREKAKGNILFEDKNRDLLEIPSVGLQLSEVVSSADPIFNTNISQSAAGVNENKKRTLQQLPGNGLQLPAMEAVSDPIHSIPARDKNINRLGGFDRALGDALLTPEQVRAQRRAGLKTKEQQRIERRIAAGIEQPPDSSGRIPPKEKASTTEPKIPKGFKERGYAETVRKKSTLPDEIKNEFVSSPEIYKVLSNEQTQKTADDIMALGIDEARNQFDRLVSGKQPAAIPLGNQLAKAYIEQGNKDAAVSVVRTMAEKLTQSGQFSQAAAIGLLKSDPPTALRYLEQQIERMNVEGRAKFKRWKDFELSADDIERMGGIDVGDTEKIKAAFEAVGKRISKEYPATAKEKIVEFSHVMMLLNPRTQIKNVAANALMLPMQTISAKVSALGQQAWRLVNPKFKPTQTIFVSNESDEIAKKIYKTVKDQIGAGTQGKWENSALDSVHDKDVFKIRKYSPTNLINKALLDSPQMERSITEQLRRFTYKLLDMGDTGFVEKNFVERLASYVEAQGFKSVDDVPSEAISVAISEAMKATFKDDNALTQLIQGIKKNTGIFGEAVLPFTKTPANVTMRSIDFSPVGIVNAIVKQVKNGGDPAQFIDRLAKGITGTTAIALGVALHRKGVITGTLSDNKREAAFQKQQGMLPFAIKVFDKHYSYDWAQPAATSLLIGAVIDQALQSEDGLGLDDVPGTVMKAVSAYGDALLNQSTLQSIRDVLGGYGSPTENVINEFAQMSQRLIPSTLGATTRSIDGTVRQTYSNDSIVQTQLDSAKSKIPGLSQTLPISYDTWGHPISRGDSGMGRAFSQFISPSNVGIANKTPLDDEVIRLYEKTGIESVFPPKSAWSILYDGKTYQLDNWSHSEHQKTTGTIAYNTLDAVFADPVYQRLSDDEKLSLVGKVYKIANEQARGQYLRSRGVDYETKDAAVLKALEAQKVGIPLAQYLIIKAESSADGNVSITQEEMKDALDSASLTNEQRGYLYKGQGWKANPYAEDTTGELVAIMPPKPRQKPKASKVAGLTDEQFTKYDDTVGGFKAEYYQGSTNEVTASRKQKVYDYVMTLPIPYEKRIGLYTLYYKDAGRVVINGQKMPNGFKPWQGK